LTDLSTVLSQNTRVTDGQTDGRTDGREFSSLDRVCITCSAVKMTCRWLYIRQNRNRE